MSLLGITNAHVPLSLNLLRNAGRYVDNSTGVLTQVVDPLDWSRQGADSPEGQMFMIMAYAAHKEWDRNGRQGNDGQGDGLGDYSSAGWRRFGVDGKGWVGVIGAAVMAAIVVVM